MEYKGNILWNTLAKGLKCISSIGSFQNKLKEMYVLTSLYTPCPINRMLTL